MLPDNVVLPIIDALDILTAPPLIFTTPPLNSIKSLLDICVVLFTKNKSPSIFVPIPPPPEPPVGAVPYEMAFDTES